MRSLRRLRAEPPVLQRSCCVYEGLASDEVQNRAFCNLADEKLWSESRSGSRSRFDGTPSRGADRIVGIASA